jgi:hypothetical protein
MSRELICSWAWIPRSAAIRAQTSELIPSKVMPAGES